MARITIVFICREEIFFAIFIIVYIIENIQRLLVGVH